ncbi:Tumor necrosis factor alpha-induced protein 2 [Saguinus oedipus]|uniref:Tumor necrosis factor alpha-induced protein 2 n=1 Tax=Saguinus oedipus TaxID=9490 RepID=A0ABQ9V6Z4_SAGOE|nr:Tumor necrosis factor alpha-induced protein 2 [Saguinus oedipus]
MGSQRKAPCEPQELAGKLGGCCCRPRVCAGPECAPSDFASYQHDFNEFLERGKRLRSYRANVIANINNCLSFRTSMEQKWQVPQDTLSLLLGPLGELKSHGFSTLLQSLCEDLKEAADLASGLQTGCPGS